MVSLVVLSGLLEVAADPAVVDESPGALGVSRLLLLGLKHVVALSAEAHPSEGSHK